MVWTRAERPWIERAEGKMSRIKTTELNKVLKDLDKMKKIKIDPKKTK